MWNGIKRLSGSASFYLEVKLEQLKGNGATFYVAVDSVLTVNVMD